MGEEADIQETETVTEDITVEENPVLSEEQFSQYVEESGKQFSQYVEQSEGQQQQVLDLEQQHHEELMLKMDEVINSINSYSSVFEVIEMGSSSIITYSVFLVPLMLLVVCGWWFFKQFIR